MGRGMSREELMGGLGQSGAKGMDLGGILKVEVPHLMDEWVWGAEVSWLTHRADGGWVGGATIPPERRSTRGEWTLG